MTRTRDVAAFLLVTLLFGGAFPAIEVGLRHVPPLLLAALRYGVSAALLLTISVVRLEYWRPRTRADWNAVLAGGIFFIGGTGPVPRRDEVTRWRAKRAIAHREQESRSRESPEVAE